jgi:F-type H+-transporting ATPase subunit b
MKRLLASLILSLGLIAPAIAADVPHGTSTETANHGDPVDHAGGGHSDAPEPSLTPEPKQHLIPALTTLIVFAILVSVLGAKAWGPIVAGLKKREDKIREDLEGAERAKLAAEAAKRDFDNRISTAEATVREMLAKATADAEKVAQNIRMQAQEEAEASKARALKDIDDTRRAAMAEVYEQAATISTQIAGRILQRNINADDQRELVRSSLDQLETVGVN